MRFSLSITLWLYLCLPVFGEGVVQHAMETMVKVGPIVGAPIVDTEGVAELDATVLIAKAGGKLTEVEGKLVHDAHGMYDLLLSVEDTDTCGQLDIVIVSGEQVHRETLMVMWDNWYSKFHGPPLVRGGGADVTADVIAINALTFVGNEVPADVLEWESTLVTGITQSSRRLPNVNVTFYNGSGVSDSGSAGMPDVNVESWNAQTITTGSNGYPVVDVGKWNSHNVYDVVEGRPDVNMTYVSSDFTAADNLELAMDGTGYAFTNCAMPTTGTATAVTTVNGLAANVITAASIATDAIDADAIKAAAIGSAELTAINTTFGVVDAVSTVTTTNTATAVTTVNGLAANVITAASLNADAVTEIVDGVDSDLSTDHGAGSWVDTGGGGATEAKQDTIIGYINTEIQAILDDTNELQTDDVPTLIGALHNFDPDNDDVKTVTDVENEVTADLVSIDGHIISGTDTQIADAFEAFFDVAAPTFTNATALADFKATGFSTLTQAQVTGGAYALDTDANGAIRIVDGVGAREINTDGGAIVSVTTTDTATATTTVNGLAANVITAASIATDAIDADAIKAAAIGSAEFTAIGTTFGVVNAVSTVNTTNTATAVTTVNGLAANVITAASLNADAVTEIVDGVDSDLSTDHGAGSWVDTGGGGATEAKQDTIIGYINTEIQAILDDTNELQTDDVPTLIGALHNFDPDNDDVKTVTDVENEVTADLVSIDGHIISGTDTQIADAFEAFFDVAAPTFTNATALADFKATGFSTHSAADVWTTGSRELSTPADYKATGFSTLTQAQVNTEVDNSMATYHLDHLLHTAYDPASKPGAADALLNELIENDGGVSRYTQNALEQAPSGTTAPNLLLSTTVATVDSQTQVTLTAGSDQDDAYSNAIVVFTDTSNSAYPSIRTATDYVGATKTLVIDAAPGFTSDMIATDGVKIFIAERTLDQAAAVDGKTMRQVLRYLGAILAGETSGAGSGTEVFKGLDGLTDRVQVIIDANGDRTTITYDP